MPTIVRRSSIALKGGSRAARTVESVELQTLREITPAQACTEADAILADAQQKADQMLDFARQAVESEMAAARSKGYEEGLSTARAEVEQECATLLTLAESIAQTLASDRENFAQQAEEDMIRLAVDVARRLTEAAIEVDPTIVLDVCRGAVRKAFVRDRIVILVHPEDAERMREASEQLCTDLGGISSFEVVTERRVDRGSVIVRTSVGEVNATFTSKAQRIEEALLDVVKSRHAA